MAQEQLLDIYSDYLISQNHHATAIGLSAILDAHITHGQSFHAKILILERPFDWLSKLICI